MCMYVYIYIMAVFCISNKELVILGYHANFFISQFRFAVGGLAPPNPRAAMGTAALGPPRPGRSVNVDNRTCSMVHRTCSMDHSTGSLDLPVSNLTLFKFTDVKLELVYTCQCLNHFGFTSAELESFWIYQCRT